MQCSVIFLSQEGLTLWPGGADSAVVEIAQSLKGLVSSVVKAWGVVGRL